MKTNSNYRRLAWSYSNSPSLEDFINKKLGAKKLYSWEYINEDSVKIFSTYKDDENSYDSVEQIKEQLTKEGIKKFYIMKTLQINLGLNNNPMTAEQVINYFATLTEYRLMAYIITDKTFHGEVEPTFVAMLEYKYARQSKVLTDAENWCSLFTQESIAISTDFMEVLAFNPSHEGDRYKFNSNLFEYIKI